MVAAPPTVMSTVDWSNATSLDDQTTTAGMLLLCGQFTRTIVEQQQNSAELHWMGLRPLLWEPPEEAGRKIVQVVAGLVHPRENSANVVSQESGACRSAVPVEHGEEFPIG